MAKEKKFIQIAIGSNIAQASGEGTTAKVEIVQHVRDALPSSAPPPSPYFVGRKNDLDSLTQVLLQKSHHALTIAILGMGGIGKTALVLKLAEEVSTSFAGGIFWADFGDSAGDPLPFVSSWGNLCGMDLSNISSSKARAQTLRSLLLERQRKSGRLLFILDDVCLNWIEGVRFLRTCFPPKVSVIITSREMQVSQTLRAIPYNLDFLTEEEARDLIIRISDSKITSNDADKIANLCGFVPLAIELASAIAIQEGTTWLIERLSDSKHRLETFH